MRTKVTLDPDVERLLRDFMRERGISFKDALNESVRAGLITERQVRSRRFVQKTFRLGEVRELFGDKALDAAASLEDEEIRRKLTRCK